jgi:hypothetical protein
VQTSQLQQIAEKIKINKLINNSPHPYEHLTTDTLLQTARYG